MSKQMVTTSLRFSRSVHAVLEQEAQHEGISFSQYVREAAIFRLGWDRGLRSSEPGASARAAIIELRNMIVHDLPADTRARFWQAPRPRAQEQLTPEAVAAIQDVRENAQEELHALLAKVSPTSRAYFAERMGLAGLKIDVS